MDGNELLAVFDRAAERVGEVLVSQDDWGMTGAREGQYKFDVGADEVVVDILLDAGLGVYSEESGGHELSRERVALVDPVDGSTNASRGMPWFSTSICVADGDGLLAALVKNLVSGKSYRAVRGGGATVDGQPLAPAGLSGHRRGSGPSGQKSLGAAMVGLTGLPSRHLGWAQYRVMGSIALDMCAVAEGALDAYIDCTAVGHATWDYMGAALVCSEAGVLLDEALNRPLLPADLGERRIPLAAATEQLLAEVWAARQSIIATDS